MKEVEKLIADIKHHLKGVEEFAEHAGVSEMDFYDDETDEGMANILLARALKLLEGSKK